MPRANTYLVWAAACLLAAPAGAHSGRRYEVVVIDQQLAAHGYNSGPADGGGSPRPYRNALFGQWDEFFGAAQASQPGFDVFTAAQSVVGQGALATLAGAGGEDLLLTLMSTARWASPTDEPGPTAPALTDLRTAGPAFGGGLFVGGSGPELVQEIGDSLTIAHDMSPGATVHEDIDYIFSVAPPAELLVMQWRIASSAPGIADSDSVFTILVPESLPGGDPVAAALKLERYLGAPLTAGDLDRDGALTATDFDHWINQYGHRPLYPGAGADANADGAVDALDYAVWREAYAASGVAAPFAAIPEPAGWSLLLVLAAGIYRPRTQRPRQG